MSINLESLRQQLSSVHVDILDEVLGYALQHRTPIPIRLVHHRFGVKPVAEAIAKLSGSAIFELHTNGTKCYQLTLIGALLSPKGSRLENLLVSYLDFLRQQFRKSPDVDEFSSLDLQGTLQLTDEDLQLLLFATSSSTPWLFSYWGGSNAEGQWCVKVRDEIAALCDVPDLHEYVVTQASEAFNQEVPVDEVARGAYFFQRTVQPLVKSDSIDSSTGVPSRKIFVVHGHDEGAREAVARFVKQIGFEPIILHEQPTQGRTVIEKVEAHGEVGFAVVLLTPDDEGCEKGGKSQPRARQNVLLELGYFIGRLGRDKVCALKRGDVDIPSDFGGVVYQPFDTLGGWKQVLGRELEAAGFEIDWNVVMRS